MNVYLGTTELDDVALQSTGLDAIHLGTEEVWNSKKELLLARNPIQGYEMVWDGVDSIGFKFQNVSTYDSSRQSHYYSGEIWIADTDYPMPPYKYLSSLPPELVTSDQVKDAMRFNGGDNLYVPGNTTAQNIYSNSSWVGINLGSYDGTPYSDWSNAYFVNTLEWQIICQMFSSANQWETPDGTSFANLTGVQIPGTFVYSSPYCFARWDANSGSTSLSTENLYYIPGDYYNNRDNYSFKAPVLGTGQGYLPRYSSAMFEISNMHVDIILGKMRMLNTTKTNYSEDT